VSFQITGRGLYRTRDGEQATVDDIYYGANKTQWIGKVNRFPKAWASDGRNNADELSINDIVGPWDPALEPNQAPTPYHRTEQFRAETARMLMLDMYRAVHAPLSGVIAESVRAADALIAALDKPAQWTGETIETNAQLHRPHSQTGESNHHTTI
jgi:hypothetical protein